MCFLQLGVIRGERKPCIARAEAARALEEKSVCGDRAIKVRRMELHAALHVWTTWLECGADSTPVAPCRAETTEGRPILQAGISAGTVALAGRHDVRDGANTHGWDLHAFPAVMTAERAGATHHDVF